MRHSYVLSYFLCILFLYLTTIFDRKSATEDTVPSKIVDSNIVASHSNIEIVVHATPNPLVNSKTFAKYINDRVL